MSDSRWKRIVLFAGLVVCVLGLLFSGALSLFQQKFDTYAQIGLAAGLLGLALAVLLNPGVFLAWLGSRQARYGANSLVMVLALLGILVLVNYLLIKNPQKMDLTEDQANTLSPQSLEVAKRLPAPVKIIAF